MNGRTTIYKTKFVKPRNITFSHGPFAGLSELKNPKTEKNEFAFNLGWNLMYGFGKLNAVFAIGAESGFSRETSKVNPYVGFGFGFALADIFAPEIKVEE